MWPHTDFPRQKLFPSIVDMLLTGEDVEFQAALPASHRVGCSAEPITGAVVPELTRSADIKLNERVSLRRCVTRLGCVTGQFPQTSGPRVAKPSGDHIPLGGFVLRKMIAKPSRVGLFV
jgi:hypothetical protein